MAIDLERQSLITFSQLASRLPPRRSGRPVHVSTVHRWRFPGIRGVRLEAIRVGGSWLTTAESFASFCRELTRSDETSTNDDVTGAPAESRVVEASLKAAGW